MHLFVCLFVPSFVDYVEYPDIDIQIEYPNNMVNADAAFVCLFVCSFVCLFIHSFIDSFIYSFNSSIHSFMHSFFHSFIHSFIHSFCGVYISINRAFLFQVASVTTSTRIREDTLLILKVLG